MTTGIANNVSARNQISGTIANIQKGAAMSVVTVSANGRAVTSAITNGAVEDLGLKKMMGELKLTTAITSLAADDLQLKQGDQVTTFFKATEVLLQKA